MEEYIKNNGNSTNKTVKVKLKGQIVFAKMGSERMENEIVKLLHNFFQSSQFPTDLLL